PQPTLSRHLRLLQEQCGAALLRRDTHRMSLTQPDNVCSRTHKPFWPTPRRRPSACGKIKRRMTFRETSADGFLQKKFSYFGGLWTSVMTGTINPWPITVPAAIVVVAVFSLIPGGAHAVVGKVAAANPAYLSVTSPDAAFGFGITLAFGLLASVVADQTFWQKVWAIRANQVTRTFMWAGALFYSIPICLGMLGLIGIAYQLTAADIGGYIVAVGPYIVSHIGLPFVLIIAYVLVILAACYSTERTRRGYAVPVVFAVAASAVVIALVGVNPIFVYLGPLLAIVTNAMIGFAFFYDRES